MQSSIAKMNFLTTTVTIASLAYVRYINASRKIIDQFLFAEQLEVDTKGSTVYKPLEQFFKRKGIPLSNVIACPTD